MVEGGNAPRAKVMDQLVIDKYLIDGLVTLAEHQAGEYILNQAVKAGVYTRPLNYSEPSSAGGKKGDISDYLLRYGNTMSLITKRFGQYASYLTEEVVCHNWDICGDAGKLKVLKDSLGLIVNLRMAGGRNPMRHIKKGCGG
jgi:hypothetical protein